VLGALIWDVDGTLAETERDGHRVAFNRAFRALGLPWCWDEDHYGRLLGIAGGRERLLHDMADRPDAPTDEAARVALAEQVHRLKNVCYADIVRSGQLPLREGVSELFHDCVRAGVRMAIATTTSRVNVEALLLRHLGADWPAMFAAVVCAEEAPIKKPDPQVYLRALAQLQLAATQVVAIEDAPAGIDAAGRAGIPVVVAHSQYFPAATGRRVLAHGPSLGRARGWAPGPGGGARRIGLSQIARWHGRLGGSDELL
jgi:beta-phosphoglucomutase-like phosphatase (HAD superfamily)